jgi:hypothetical protein
MPAYSPVSGYAITRSFLILASRSCMPGGYGGINGPLKRLMPLRVVYFGFSDKGLT